MRGEDELMVKNNRTNEEDLREAVKEKARLAKEQEAQSQVREAEKEQREGIGEQAMRSDG